MDETIEAFNEAKSRLGIHEDNLTLFHSRFCMADRIRIENLVLEKFGKSSTPKQRQGQLLIASPILDQSLDADLTVMISDVAPIDVLVQRLGRCCRHVRDENELRIEGDIDGRGKPVLHLHGPAFTNDPDKDWLKKFSRGTQAIYQDTALIWLTVQKLLETGQVSMPGLARELIEAVYGPGVKDDLPEVLQQQHLKVSGTQASESFMAKFNQLDPTQGYSRQSNSAGWADESRTPTRLIDDTVDFVLLLAKSDGQLSFYAENTAHPLDMSKISLRKTQLTEIDETTHTSYLEQVEQLKEEHPQLKFCELLILKADDYGQLHGQGIQRKSDKGAARVVSVVYDPLMGFKVMQA